VQTAAAGVACRRSRNKSEIPVKAIERRNRRLFVDRERAGGLRYSLITSAGFPAEVAVVRLRVALEAPAALTFAIKPRAAYEGARAARCSNA
jgi:hypothetical protein